MINKIRGRKLYKTFHKFDAKKVSNIFIDFDPNDYFVQLGTVQEIVYRSDKWDGKKTDYIHSFKKKPKLITNSKGNLLLLVDGSFSITDRGILK